MQFRIDDRTANHLYLLTEDFQEVKPTQDGVQIRVPYCHEYAKDARFRQAWNGSLVVNLRVSQALEAIAQDRQKDERDKVFCEGCFDWGTVTEVPQGCARCMLLQALRKGRHGDYRKKAGKSVSAPAVQRSPLLCWLLLAAVLVTSWALCAWTEAAARVEQLEKVVQRVKQ